MNQDTEVLKTIALAITPLLVTVIGFLVKQSLSRLTVSQNAMTAQVHSMDKDFIGVKKDIERLSEMLGSIKHIRDEWLAMKQEVSLVVLEIKGLKSSLEDVVILKRDQQTIWKHIDELRQDVKEAGK